MRICWLVEPCALCTLHRSSAARIILYCPLVSMKRLVVPVCKSVQYSVCIVNDCIIAPVGTHVLVTCTMPYAVCCMLVCWYAIFMTRDQRLDLLVCTWHTRNEDSSTSYSYSYSGLRTPDSGPHTSQLTADTGTTGSTGIVSYLLLTTRYRVRFTPYWSTSTVRTAKVGSMHLWILHMSYCHTVVSYDHTSYRRAL